MTQIKNSTGTADLVADQQARGDLVAGHARLLVKKLDPTSVTTGNVILPAAMREESVDYGEVLSVGATDDMHGTIGAEVGDKIWYHPVYVRVILGHAKRMPPPTVIDKNGKPVIVLMQSEVLAIEKA